MPGKQTVNIPMTRDKICHALDDIITSPNQNKHLNQE